MMKTSKQIYKMEGYEPMIHFSNNQKIIVQKTTNKCNNNCIFCVLPDCLTDYEKNHIPSTGYMKQVIDSYDLDGISPGTIAFTTAEPTLREDLRGLLNYTFSKYPQSEISILTNARRFSYKNYAQTFKRLFNHITLEIPLHGPNPKIHDTLTRANNSFNQTVNGIKNIFSVYPNTKINIRVLVHKSNYKHLDETLEFIKKEFPKASSIILIYISMIGSSKLNFESLFLMPNELKKETNKTLKKQKNTHIQLFHFPYCILDKELWGMNAGRTLPDKDIEFSNKCLDCSMRKKCCGFWKSEFNHLLFKEISPIGHDVKAGLLKK